MLRPTEIDALIANNRAWAEAMRARDPRFFERLKNIHQPEFFWIGCSDARVPANELIGLTAGEVFVHRNIANQVQAADLSCAATIEFAVSRLRVRHILIVGHSDCGGVKAAIRADAPELVQHWVHPIRELYLQHRAELDALPEPERTHRLVRMNVVTQIERLAQNPVIRRAWDRSEGPMLHGWIYDVGDGLLEDLGVSRGPQG